MIPDWQQQLFDLMAKRSITLTVVGEVGSVVASIRLHDDGSEGLSTEVETAEEAIAEALDDLTRRSGTGGKCVCAGYGGAPDPGCPKHGPEN